METVVIVIHLMVVVALVAVVLLQRSEGGALGIGGGAGFLTARGSANVLTRSTAVLAAVFFLTSVLLTVMARLAERPSSLLDTVPGATTGQPGTPGGLAPAGNGNGILDQLGPINLGPSAPPPPAPSSGAVTPAPGGVPAASAPAAPAPAASAPAAPAAPPAAATPPSPPSGQ